MNIQTKTGNQMIDPSVVAHAEDRLRKLSRLFDESRAEVLAYLDFTRESGSHSSDEMWRASVRVAHGGKEFHATEAAQTPEAAANEALYELTREIQRTRGKNAAILRRGGALLKRTLRRE